MVVCLTTSGNILVCPHKGDQWPSSKVMNCCVSRTYLTWHQRLLGNTNFACQHEWSRHMLAQTCTCHVLSRSTTPQQSWNWLASETAAQPCLWQCSLLLSTLWEQWLECGRLTELVAGKTQRLCDACASNT